MLPEIFTTGQMIWMVIGGAAFWFFFVRQKPENKLWRDIAVKNTLGEYPHLIDKDQTADGMTYVFYIPDGISMELLRDPKSPKYQMLKQSLADGYRMDVVPIDGHKLACKVIMRELQDMYEYRPEPADKVNPLVFEIGQSAAGPVRFTIGDNAPHLCVAGTTGSGKSVCLRSMITSLILHPKRIDLWLIDLKGGVEFQPFMDCGRVSGYAKSVAEGIGILSKLQDEMVRRNELFFRCGCNSIDSYNAAHPENKMRRHILFVDEFAEFSASKDKRAQEILKDLLRRARSCGIHVVIATQRPDADVLDGQIRANMPAYICFLVSSTSNSVVILGHGGAEALPGKGRGILRAPGRKETEFQGYFLSEDDCRHLVAHTYVKKPNPTTDTEGVYIK